MLPDKETANTKRTGAMCLSLELHTARLSSTQLMGHDKKDDGVWLRDDGPTLRHHAISSAATDAAMKSRQCQDFGILLEPTLENEMRSKVVLIRRSPAQKTDALAACHEDKMCPGTFGTQIKRTTFAQGHLQLLSPSLAEA